MEKNIISLLLVLVIGLSGCDVNDFLDQKYEAEVNWQRVDDLEYSVNVCYYSINAGFCETVPIYSYYDYTVSGMARPTGSKGSDANFDEIYGRKHRDIDFVGKGWMGKPFEHSYLAITPANDVLSFLNSADPEVLFPKDTKAYIDANVPRVKAELHFWRAFSYFYLALFYHPPYNPGGDNSKRALPLKTDIYKNENTKIGTTQEIYDLIISDLKEAKKLMPTDWYKEGRINYNTVVGLLARVYFYTGQYSLAETECAIVIDRKDEAKFLSSHPMDAWTRTNGDPEPEEVLFSVVPNSMSRIGIWECASVITKNAVGTTGGGRHSVSEGTSWFQSAWVSTILSNQFIKKIGWMVDPENGNYTETDLARSDKRYGNTWLRLEEYKTANQIKEMINKLKTQGLTDEHAKEQIFNKYERRNSTLTFPHIYLDKYYRGPSQITTRNPVMRLPEFYLTRAAIRFKNGNVDGATSDVNVVRKRAGLAPLTSVTDNDIEREWIIEFGGEGLYLGYMMAMRKPIPAGDRLGVEPFMPPYKNWYWRIPQAELDYNQGYGNYNPNIDD